MGEANHTQVCQPSGGQRADKGALRKGRCRTSNCYSGALNRPALIARACQPKAGPMGIFGRRRQRQTDQRV